VSPLVAVRTYLAATDEQRAAVLREYGDNRSAAMVWGAIEALSDAGLDVLVSDLVPEAVMVAEVALRHRDRIGRVPGFGPAEYAEMVTAMRLILGELHPDDAADLAAQDLWESQDRWTGERVGTASACHRGRTDRALRVLRTSAAAAI
jgi:hypothetical protein